MKNILILFSFVFLLESTCVYASKWCNYDEKTNKVTGNKNALCCKTKDGKLVQNKDNPRSKNVVCCGDSKDKGGKGTKSQESYTSLASRCLSINNTIAAKQKEIKRLEKEKDNIKNLTDEEAKEKLDKIDAKINELKEQIDSLSKELQECLDGANAVKGQIASNSELGYLHGSTEKMNSMDKNRDCIRGNGEPCV